MPNPWDLQPRASAWLDEDVELDCPVCANPTDSLKQYRYVGWVVFYLAGATYSTTYYRACPGCVRKFVARRAARNLVPANLLWPLLVLPWGLGLVVASYRRGHSAAVIRQITPAAAAAREAAAGEVSWGRVWVIVAVLFCWAPLFGPALAGVAYLTNRRAAGWKRTAAVAALVASVLAHVAFVVLVAIN